MPRFYYSKAHIAWLKANAIGVPVYELTDRFNEQFLLCKTYSQIRCCLKNNDIKVGIKSPKRPSLRAYSPEQIEWIKDCYRTLPLKQLHTEFNRIFQTDKTLMQIRGVTRNHQLKSGRTGQFTPGHVPANKGHKRRRVSKETEFKKGHRPANTTDLYTERTQKHGYIEVKIPEPNPYTQAATRYRLKHLYVWEQVNGPVPPGHCLKFLDGDRTNCMLENLTLIERALLPELRWRGYDQAPEALKPAILANARLKQKIRQIEKSTSPSRA